MSKVRIALLAVVTCVVLVGAATYMAQAVTPVDTCTGDCACVECECGGGSGCAPCACSKCGPTAACQCEECICAPCTCGTPACGACSK